MKLAIILPGVGYHTDKPLLYYSKKIARAKGYEIVELSYDFSSVDGPIKFDPNSMEKAIDLGFEQVVNQLSKVEFSAYDRVVFIGKSIGTAIGAKYDMTYQVGGEHIVFTPVMATFDYLENCQGLVFHGSADPLCDTDECIACCEEMSLTYAVVPSANHSLETGAALDDIEIIKKVMQTVEKML